MDGPDTELGADPITAIDLLPRQGKIAFAVNLGEPSAVAPQTPHPRYLPRILNKNRSKSGTSQFRW